MSPILSALFILFLAMPAQAANQDMPTTQKIRPVYHRNGALRLCLAESTYTDQRKLTIALTPREEIQFALQIPDGHFIKKRHYDVSLQLNQAPPRNIRSIALSDEILLLKIGSNPSFIEKLSQSTLLSISSGTKKITFNLPAMDPVISQLQSCAKATQATTHQTSIPLPSQAVSERRPVMVPSLGPTTSTPKPTQPLVKRIPDYLASPKALHNFLQETGLNNPKLVHLDDVPTEERVADYVWKTGAILGGIRRQQVPQGTSLSQLIGLHIKGLRQKCEGSFRSYVGKEQTTANAQLRYAGARCSFPEPTEKDKENEDAPKQPPSVVVSLLFSLSPDSKFTVFTHEGTKEYGQDIRQARNKVGNYLIGSTNTTAPINTPQNMPTAQEDEESTPRMNIKPSYRRPPSRMR